MEKGDIVGHEFMGKLHLALQFGRPASASCDCLICYNEYLTDLQHWIRHCRGSWQWSVKIQERGQSSGSIWFRLWKLLLLQERNSQLLLRVGCIHRATCCTEIACLRIAKLSAESIFLTGQTQVTTQLKSSCMGIGQEVTSIALEKYFVQNIWLPNPLMTMTQYLPARGKKGTYQTIPSSIFSSFLYRDGWL